MTAEVAGQVRRRGRRDSLLWLLAVLIAAVVAAHLIAEDYYLENAAFECFPYCTFKQDLSNNVAGGAPFVVFVLAAAGAIRCLRRRPPGVQLDAASGAWCAAALGAAIWVAGVWQLFG